MLYAILLYLVVGISIVAYLWYRDDYMLRGALLRVGTLLALFYPLWFVGMLVDRFQRRRRKHPGKRRSKRNRKSKNGRP